MNKLEVAKKAIKYGVGASTTHVVKKIIKKNSDPETPREHAEVWVCAIALGGMAGEAAEAWTSKTVDQVATIFTDLKEQLKKEQS